MCIIINTIGRRHCHCPVCLHCVCQELAEWTLCSSFQSSTARQYATWWMIQSQAPWLYRARRKTFICIWTMLCSLSTSSNSHLVRQSMDSFGKLLMDSQLLFVHQCRGWKTNSYCAGIKWCWTGCQGPNIHAADEAEAVGARGPHRRPDCPVQQKFTKLD